MPVNPEFGQRAREARRRWALAHDAELTYGDIGQRTADAMGRGEPFSHQAVRRWFVDGQEPDSFATTAALAAVLEVPPEWLAFGLSAPVEPVAAPHAPRQPARPDIASGTPGQERNRVEGPSPHARAKEEGRKRGRRSGA